jgi:hypothetical protein
MIQDDLPTTSEDAVRNVAAVPFDIRMEGLE